MLVLDENGNLTEIEPDQYQADLAAEMREYLAARADKNGYVSSDALSDWVILDRDRNVKLEDALFNRLDVIKKKVANEQQREEELETVRDQIEHVQKTIKGRVGFITELVVAGSFMMFLTNEGVKMQWPSDPEFVYVPGPPIVGGLFSTPEERAIDDYKMESYHNLVKGIYEHKVCSSTVKYFGLGSH